MTYEERVEAARRRLAVHIEAARFASDIPAAIDALALCIERELRYLTYHKEPKRCPETRQKAA